MDFAGDKLAHLLFLSEEFLPLLGQQSLLLEVLFVQSFVARDIVGNVVGREVALAFGEEMRPEGAFGELVGRLRLFFRG